MTVIRLSDDRSSSPQCWRWTAQKRIQRAALAFNTLAQFTVSNGGRLPDPLLFYVRYVLPLSIIAVPYLWKRIVGLIEAPVQQLADEYNQAAGQRRAGVYTSNWGPRPPSARGNGALQD